MKIEKLSSKRRFTPNKYNVPYYYEKDIKKSLKNLKEELKKNLSDWIYKDNPPFCIDEDNIEEAVDEIDKAFEKYIGDLE